jgi:hypothetical protein
MSLRSLAGISHLHNRVVEWNGVLLLYRKKKRKNNSNKMDKQNKKEKKKYVTHIVSGFLIPSCIRLFQVNQ